MEQEQARLVAPKPRAHIERLATLTFLSYSWYFSEEGSIIYVTQRKGTFEWLALVNSFLSYALRKPYGIKIFPG